jgi:hypothetical protein
MKSASDTLQKVRSSIEYTEREIKDKELELSRTSTPLIRYCCVHLTSPFYPWCFSGSEKAVKDALPADSASLEAELQAAEDEVEYRTA